MAHLKLENLGPISAIDIQLRRYNIFIGPQSSGKSTIAKMISFCMWIEKRVATTLNEQIFQSAIDFRTTAESYHKLKGYFYPETIIYYKSDVVEISYKEETLDISLLDKYAYLRKKISYIPADRNLVATPNLETLEVINSTNLKSFLFDWFSARNSFDRSHKLSLLNLNMQYYYDQNNINKIDRDRIVHINGKTYEISLSNASSGLQSITPLILMTSYYSDQYFNEYDKVISFEKQSERQTLQDILKQEFPDKQENNQIVNANLADTMSRAGVAAQNFVNYHSRNKIYNQLTIPQSTNFIIEEPEQNLFPTTQIQLIQYLVSICNNGQKTHCFTITTHSPYILSQLNIQLFAGRLMRTNKLDKIQQESIQKEEINVYAVLEDGTINNIIDDESGLISQNYLDSASVELAERFEELYKLL